MLNFDKSPGMHDLGSVNWKIYMCLIGIHLMCYFALWKGVKISGKVAQPCFSKAFIMNEKH